MHGVHDVQLRQALVRDLAGGQRVRDDADDLAPAASTSSASTPMSPTCPPPVPASADG
ncbi:MAG: hypothetical protein R2712_09705 [Vicinamibacterales bacterium]